MESVSHLSIVVPSFTGVSISLEYHADVESVSHLSNFGISVTFVHSCAEFHWSTILYHSDVESVSYLFIGFTGVSIYIYIYMSLE